MVQTRPELPGARFALDGNAFLADRNGLALTTVAAPGTYELEVLSPRIELDGTTHSFAVWAGGERARSRRLEVGSFTLLEAGFDTTRDVSFSFTDESGTAIDPAIVDRATIIESGGDNRYRLTGNETTSVVVSRAVPEETGVRLRPVSYRLNNAVVDGEDVSVSGASIEVGTDRAVAIPLAVAPTASQAGEEPPEPNNSVSERNDDSSSAVLWGVLAAIQVALLVVGSVWVGRRRPELEKWLRALRRELSDAVTRVTAHRNERPVSRRTGVLGSVGRVLWKATALPLRRSDRSGEGGAATPQSSGSTSSVIRLGNAEETPKPSSQEAIDLRDASSTGAIKHRRSNDRSVT